MHERFVEDLDLTGRIWRLLTGTPDQRLAEAVRQVDALLRAPVGPRTSR